MCGIFGYISGDLSKSIIYDKKLLENIQINFENFPAKTNVHLGGPDTTKTLIKNNVYLGFHRLRIMDLSDKGDQPFNIPQYDHLYLVCNGEIYNYKSLIDSNNFNYYSESDCEIILHMYNKYGIKKTVESLDGVFAFLLYDTKENLCYVARDPIGVRSLYIGYNDNFNKKHICISSELKGLTNLVEKVQVFPPGEICKISNRTEDIDMEDSYLNINSLVLHFEKYYYCDNKQFCLSNKYNEKFEYISDTEPNIMKNIEKKLDVAVKKRLMSCREIGCLLSGGLDSSLITALVVKNNPDKKIHTFSIGLKNSTDIKYAKIVSDYLNTEHHEVILTEEEMLQSIEEDIYIIETYDTTTIRASTPMYLLAKYIKKNTNITVLFSGEGSDEASGSYMYFHKAPNSEEFQKECIRLIKDLNRFDVLRCDKSIAGAGLEVRVPFLDLDFMNYYMGINPELKMPRNSFEKYLLRKSFEASKLLPSSVLWRVKEGMSDGVSSLKKSWYQIIQEYTEQKISEDDKKQIYGFNPPMFNEAIYYRKLFNKYFAKRDKLIPYYWLPKWCGNITEPSARVLTVYNQESKKKVQKTNNYEMYAILLGSFSIAIYMLYNNIYNS